MIPLRLLVCLLLLEQILSFAGLWTTFRSSRSSRTCCLDATKIILAPPLEPVNENMPTDIPPLEIVYTTEAKDIDRWLNEHVPSKKLLGFDTESVPVASFLSYGRNPYNEKNGPATIQLSTLESCLVVHLKHSQSTQLSSLQEVLKDDSILKAGVGIDDDALELYRSGMSISVNSRFDLGCLLEQSSEHQRMGLGPLLNETAGLVLPKSKKISMSNWGAKELTKKQLIYAAYDAWAAAKIVDAVAIDLEQIKVTLKQQERSLKDIDFRARTRKKAKTEWKQIKGMEGKKKEQGRLWQIMSEMRPDPPLMLNISLAQTIGG